MWREVGLVGEGKRKGEKRGRGVVWREGGLVGEGKRKGEKRGWAGEDEKVNRSYDL